MADDKSAFSVTSSDTLGIDPKNPKSWGSLLTLEYRANFESKGVDIVRSEVQRRVYGDDRKHFAAMAWLKEKGDEDTQDQTNTHDLILIGVIATIIGVMIGAIAVVING